MEINSDQKIIKEKKEKVVKEKKEKVVKEKKEKVVKEKPIPISLKKCFNDSEPNVYEIGVDEVGRGPLFGRVYAAAVILPKDDSFDHSRMKDSKKFTSKIKIIEAAEYIKANAISWAIHYESEKVIDDINILQATQSAMHKCIGEIIKKKGLAQENTKLIIDGNYFKSYTIFNVDKKRIEQIDYTCVEGGDNKYSSIAAASILAKVARDQYIEELCVEHPDLIEKYSLDSNKGYGSKKHMDGIKEHGITVWHRRSFKPCTPFTPFTPLEKV